MKSSIFISSIILALVVVFPATTYAQSNESANIAKALGGLIGATKQACADKPECNCSQFSSTQTDLPLRYTKAQECPVNSTDGKRHSMITTWDKENHVVDIGMMIDGMSHGEWKSWHSNGVLTGQATFDNGKRHGAFTTWHPNGRVAVEGHYLNDQPDGEWVYYTANGDLEKKYLFQHGALVSKSP